MRSFLALVVLIVLCFSCGKKPKDWAGPVLTPDRQYLRVKELTDGLEQPLVDQSFFAKPRWATAPKHNFSGILTIEEALLTFPKEKDFYPGENIFPELTLRFASHEGMLIPENKERISTIKQASSYWDVFVGTGEMWQEEGDGLWSRASFPLTLTDRWIGTAKNCVASFVYTADSISNLCLQCSQETADIDDKGIGNINGILPAGFQPLPVQDSTLFVTQHLEDLANRISLAPLTKFDLHGEIAAYFEQPIVTSAPTSLGAVFRNDTLYLHPPKTRHGLYPYPAAMRHGLYSVTKSMAGALSLLYLEERYEDDLFSLFITDYVPALRDHPGWQGVTFGQTLNMVTGVNGGEDAAQLFETLIIAPSAEEAISNIAKLADAPPLPGQAFNYASTNLFVLSYALQSYVNSKEEESVNYWDLLREELLTPIGAARFPVLHTIEENPEEALPILAYGALPTIDEAAKIARLFANDGRHNGQQLLARDKVEEIFGKTDWPGHSTNNDYRGSGYQHGFWSKEIKTKNCRTKATFMLGFGENYVIFLPSGSIVFRFLDEHDLNVDALIKAVERIAPSCQ